MTDNDDADGPGWVSQTQALEQEGQLRNAPVEYLEALPWVTRSGQRWIHQDTLRELLNVLGLKMEEKIRETSAADEFINLLLELRTELRAQKNFALGDKIRIRLTELGVIIEDSKEGTTWRWQ